MTYHSLSCENDCTIILVHWDTPDENTVVCPNCEWSYFYDDTPYLPLCCKGHHVCEECIDESCLPYTDSSEAENPNALIGKVELVGRAQGVK